jgi:hypothetical protein
MPCSAEWATGGPMFIIGDFLLIVVGVVDHDGHRSSSPPSLVMGAKVWNFTWVLFRIVI